MAYSDPEKKRQWYLKNKERVRAKHRAYYEENRDKFREYEKKRQEEKGEEIRAYQRQWREDNRERILEYRDQYYSENREYLVEKAVKWGKENRDRRRKAIDKYNETEKGAIANKAYRNNRRKRTREASLGDLWRKECQAVYKKALELSKMTGTKYEVDHIVPLLAKNVCGLHVPWNLTIIASGVNRTKSNTYIDTEGLSDSL